VNPFAWTPEEADHDIARCNARSVEHAITVDGADACPREVELVVSRSGSSAVAYECRLPGESAAPSTSHYLSGSCGSGDVVEQHDGSAPQASRR
jgi:hypothetical protein